MSKPIKVFSGIMGLNNAMHPVSLGRTKEGLIEVAEAVNIDISNRGKPYRRYGQTATAMTDACHSFYSTGDYGFCVSGADLLKVSNSFAVTILKSGLTSGQTMSYCETAGKVFYANGYENGYIQDDTNYAWLAPMSNWQAVDSSKTFSSPPVGHKICAAFGRIFIAQDSVLWFTEPFAPLMCDMARNAIPFNSRIKEIVPVSDGIFISTSNKLTFLAGTDPMKMEQKFVSNAALIPGTAVYVETDAIPDVDNMGWKRISSGPVYIATSNRGICVLGNDGFFQNMTKQKLDLSETYSEGSAYIYNGKYVVSLK